MGIWVFRPNIRLLRGEHHRERVVSPEEKRSIVAAAGGLIAEIASPG